MGTGFSFGDSFLTNMKDATDEFVYFLERIWEKFPDFSSKELYLSGESYAGHYIPRFSDTILKNGSFNLKASLIGDPYTAA